MLQYMKRRSFSPSDYEKCVTVADARLRNRDANYGRLAGEYLGKRMWAQLETIIRDMPAQARVRFTDTACTRNREFRERLFTCINCCNFSLNRVVVDGCDSCESCSRTAPVASCGHRSFLPSEVLVHDSNGVASHYERRCRSCARNLYYWDSDGRTHTIPPPPVIVGHYHSSRGAIEKIGKTIPGLQDIGFELEWGPIPPTLERRDEISAELRGLGDIVAGVEQDGSISSINGAEIVTHYGSMDAVLSGAAKISNVLKGKAKSHNTTCCGLHVSISRSGLTNLDIARFVVFWNNPKNTRFLVAFARRWSNQYCVQDFDKGTYKIPGREYDIDSFVWTGNSRYEIVNLCNNSRIEVRAFRGTTNRDMLRRCISLCVWIMAYCQDTKCRKLHYTDFLNWCKTAQKKRGRRKFRPSDILSFAKQRGFLKENDSKPSELKNPAEGSVAGVTAIAPEATLASTSLRDFEAAMSGDPAVSIEHRFESYRNELLYNQPF